VAPEKKEDADIVNKDRILMDMPNVIITPHMAFDTTEGVERILDTTIANIVGFAGGKSQNLIPNP